MIKINLIAEKKAPKAKAAGAVIAAPGVQTRSLLLVGILGLGVVVAGAWWWAKNRELAHLKSEIRKAEVELVRLEEVRKKGEAYKTKKALLERQIQLVTDLKKKQTVPVHILDQVSKNLPDFLWLDSMTAQSNQISIRGKATTYNAVSNFYNSLTGSGFFQGVVLGRTSEIPEGVAFSLNCAFTPPGEEATAPPPSGG